MGKSKIFGRVGHLIKIKLIKANINPSAPIIVELKLLSLSSLSIQELYSFIAI